jgi:hypothetical protein
MTRAQIEAERKRLQTVWQALNAADDALAHTVQGIRAELRRAFQELLKADEFLGELENQATDEQAETAGGAP